MRARCVQNERKTQRAQPLLTCHRPSTASAAPGRAHARRSAWRGASRCALVLAAARRSRFVLRMRPQQPRTAAPSAPACVALRADAGATRGGRTRRRSGGGRLAQVTLALACTAAALQLVECKPLASMAIMKLNQIDPTVRHVAGRRNCARRCCAAHWGLRGQSRAAARCASPCVPMGAARRTPAACGWRSALRRARPGGRERAVRKRQFQA